jgi:hypothetical protein
MDCEDYLVSNLTVLLLAERLAKLQSVFIFKLQQEIERCKKVGYQQAILQNFRKI